MKHKKILPKHHTGKLVHHQHTAYGALIGVLMLAFMPLFLVSKEVANAAPEDPVTSNYTTHAVVPGPVPQTAASINTPAQNTVINGNDPVQVSGSCQSGMLIKIFKNDVLAGAAFCADGRFDIDIDIFLGPNSLIARTYNANNVIGPDSGVVTVTRNQAGQSANPFQPIPITEQFLITSDVQYRGISVGQKLTWQFSVSGGKAPYAVSISWGDGKTDLISRSQPGSFEVSHIYEKGGEGPQGSHDITVLATDSDGTKSFINFETIVSGNEPTVVGSIKAGYNWSAALKIAWQLVVIAIVIIFSFWLGEKRHALHFRRRVGSV